MLHAEPPTRSPRSFLVSAEPAALRTVGAKWAGTHGRKATAVISQASLNQLRRRKIPLLIHTNSDALIADEFLTPKELLQELQRLVKMHPKRAELVDLNQRFQTPKSEEGRRLWALRIRDNLQDKTPRPSILLDSLHHSRELITPLVTLDAAKQLLEEGTKDTQIQTWLRHYEVWIVPLVNPDGYHHVFQKDPMWRKNRRPNSDGSFGVDLNRNYPYLWGACGRNSHIGASHVYKGPAAASEPEVKTLLALGEWLRPSLYLTFHSYGNEVIYPYMCRAAAEATLIASLTQKMGQAAQYKNRIASSSGESFEHFYNRFGSLAFLIEVGDSFFPAVERIEGLLLRARQTWRVAMERGLQAGISGVVLDMATKQPIKAQLVIDEIAFQAGELRQSRRRDGWFHWLVTPGRYTLRVQAPGYREWRQVVQVNKTQRVQLSIELWREDADGVDDGEALAEPRDAGPEHTSEWTKEKANLEQIQTEVPRQDDEVWKNDSGAGFEAEDAGVGKEFDEENDTNETTKPRGDVSLAGGCRCDTRASLPTYSLLVWSWLLLCCLGMRRKKDPSTFRTHRKPRKS